jgi:hypothetical protein
MQVSKCIPCVTEGKLSSPLPGDRWAQYSMSLNIIPLVNMWTQAEGNGMKWVGRHRSVL